LSGDAAEVVGRARDAGFRRSESRCLRGADKRIAGGLRWILEAFVYLLNSGDGGG
jgi:hypothetical protein